MTSKSYSSSGYCLTDYLNDSRFLDAARERLGYDPNSTGSFGDIAVPVMRQIIKKEGGYDSLHGRGDVMVLVDDCTGERIVQSFRNMYLQKKANMSQFRKRAIQSLVQDWRNYLLFGMIAKIDGDEELAYQCDERIGRVLDSMDTKERGENLAHILNIQQGYEHMYARK
ncbi:hypothetical protein A3K72_04385 [Candidatus Woesearchaeota archaeon RBG_13_36_6]|nr:MAG: hypothetical protein A3K72_04385 [Candidatus Woesearchaeota archaeon RBG_13_36_6]